MKIRFKMKYRCCRYARIPVMKKFMRKRSLYFRSWLRMIRSRPFKIRIKKIATLQIC